MKAKVNKDLCIGCGICPDICPDVFDMQEDGKAAVIVDPVPPWAEDTCWEAVSQCPEEAITVEEE